MAREVQVLAWCDVHMAEDQRVPMVATHTVALDGGAPRTLDLCEEHEAALWKPFADVAALGAKAEANGAPKAVQAGPRALGGIRRASPRTVTANKSDANTRVCLLCSATLEGRNIHDRHLVQAHGLPKVMALYGDACPFCGETFSTPQGLAIHGTNSHGHYDLAALFWAARDAGDPHGVVAAALERVVALGGTVEPVADVLSRADLDAQRLAEVHAAAEAVRAAGKWPGSPGVAQVVADALGIPRSRAGDRIARAKELGLFDTPPLAPGATRVEVHP